MIPGIKFWPFPKPCPYFRKEQTEKLAVLHAQHQCLRCSSAMTWLKDCYLKNYTSISQITKEWFVCSLHFEDGAPTQAQPYPSQAGSTASTVSQTSRLLKFCRIFCLLVYLCTQSDNDPRYGKRSPNFYQIMNCCITQSDNDPRYGKRSPNFIK